MRKLGGLSAFVRRPRTSGLGPRAQARGLPLFAGVPFHEAVDRLCPACTCLLSPERKGQFRLDACADCGGVWLETAQIRKLVEKKSSVLLDFASEAASKGTTKPEAHVARRCPECDKPLKTVSVNDKLDIDVCNAHGTWFDREELARYVNKDVKPKTAPVDKVEAVAGIIQILAGVLEILGSF